MVCMAMCLVGISSSQLFPFSTLHQHALKEATGGPTETAPAESVHQVRIETNERPSRHAGSAPEPLTVLVTPRPKYRPQNFVQEPSVGPNNASVPSMMDDKSIQERMKAHHHHRVNPEKLNEAQTVVKPLRTQIKTVVDSVPSLSVVIPADLTNSNGPPDYLRPPRFPSVYNKKPTLSDFNTTPLRDQTKGSKESMNFYPRKEWHRKPDKKNTVKRKIRGKTTEPNLSFESQIQWGPPSSSLDTFTHKAPNYQLDPFYEHYIEHVLQEPQNQFTTFHEQQISSFSSPPSGWELEDEQDSTRVNYQVKGHRGPETYKFGYDTGLGKERMFRFEEKDEDGSIKGQYGYYDKKGKLQVVTYEADKDGFRAIPT